MTTIVILVIMCISAAWMRSTSSMNFSAVLWNGRASMTGANSCETGWKARSKAEALAFRADFEALVSMAEASINLSAYGPHADHLIEVSFARGRGSQHWFTMALKWGVFLYALLDARIETLEKDSIILSPGPLTGGKSEDGTRKIKDSVGRTGPCRARLRQRGCPPRKASCSRQRTGP